MSMTDISLRDHFAGEVLVAVYSEVYDGSGYIQDFSIVAKRCYQMADAMITERDAKAYEAYERRCLKESEARDKEAVQYNWKEVGVIISNKEPTETDTVVFRNDQYLAWRWLVPSLNPMFSSCKDEP